MRTSDIVSPVRREISRFPRKERPHMPGSPTTPDLRGACDDAPRRVAFPLIDDVGVRDKWLSRLNGWPMRSPADADDAARLGVDVVRYSFIV